MDTTSEWRHFRWCKRIIFKTAVHLSANYYQNLSMQLGVERAKFVYLGTHSVGFNNLCYILLFTFISYNSFYIILSINTSVRSLKEELYKFTSIDRLSDISRMKNFAFGLQSIVDIAGVREWMLSSRVISLMVLLSKLRRWAMSVGLHGWCSSRSDASTSLPMKNDTKSSAESFWYLSYVLCAGCKDSGAQLDIHHAISYNRALLLLLATSFVTRTEENVLDHGVTIGIFTSQHFQS